MKKTSFNKCKYRQKTGMKSIIYCKVSQCNYAVRTCNACWLNSCTSVFEITGNKPEQLEIQYE